MKIKGIQLFNYRNFANETAVFKDGVNLICGNNAQGKTNMLEGIYLLSTGKSHRGNKDSELTLFNAPSYMVRTKAVKNGIDNKISIGYDKATNKRKLKINDVEKKKLSEFIGCLNVVLFTPDDLQLIKGSPNIRRRFLDDEISQIYPVYYQQLLEYNKILMQRNAILKDGKYNKTKLNMLPILDTSLATVGSKIIKKRLEIINELAPLSIKLYSTIANGRNEVFKLSYSSSIENLKDIDDLTTITAKFNESLQKNSENEIARGVTLVGPQRDDFNVFINEMETKSYGSQGQQRSCVLALKLGEMELIKEEIGEYPVLLLDDVFSELDCDRRDQILKMIQEQNIQTFITETDTKILGDFKGANIISINNGRVSH